MKKTPIIFGSANAHLADPSLNTDIDLAKIAYERDGYLVYDFGFSADLINQCEAITRGFLGKFTRIQDLWMKKPPVKSLSTHPAVLELLTHLYGRKPFPFQTLNFSVGTQQATHADTYHFNSVPEHFMCGVWVALEDIDMENGPLHYFAGSHKRPIAQKKDIDEASRGDVVSYFKDASRPYEKNYGLIKKGQAIIWAANLLHGGDPIIDKSRSRLSQVTHYYFEDCLYTTPLLIKETGKKHIRYPVNLITEKFVFSRENGKRVRPDLRTFVVAYIKKWIRRTPSN